MKVYCLVKDCRYRSNRKTKYTTVGGQPLFNCKREYIIINNQFDPDGVSPFDNNTICSGYEPIEKEG